MNRLATSWQILRHLGPSFIGRRLRIAIDRRTGRTARLYPARRWESVELEQLVRPGTPVEPAAYAEFKRQQAIPFFFPAGSPPTFTQPWKAPAAQGEFLPLQERVKHIQAGAAIYFFHTPTPAGVDWYVNTLTGGRGDREKPWWAIPDFQPSGGDARTLWEPARCAWAMDLTRALSRSISAADTAQRSIDNAGQPQWPDAASLAEACWGLLDAWMSACPPWIGFHWKCGQEASVRFLALGVGCWAFQAHATPTRWLDFARLAWATGYRVAHHIQYAVSQKNNHAISEAMGLLLVSHLFPEFVEAAEWRATGRRVLADALRSQIYADGSYVQNSMNYHRVMLQGGLVSLRLAELAGEPFERDLYDRLAKAGEFIFQMMEPKTGRLPAYGDNDSALVWPMSDCPPGDFRPVVQTVDRLTRGAGRFPPGPWDEDATWLLGPPAVQSPTAAPAPQSSAFRAGGYHTLRGANGWAMTRCHMYHDRPAHNDPLHVDVWMRGHNLLRDNGSYQYYTPAEPALAAYFKSLRAHNAVMLDDCEPIEHVSQFLWFPWPRARLRHYVPDDAASAGVGWLEGERLDYDRKPWRAILRRCVVRLPNGAWLVVDDVLGQSPTSVTLRWHVDGDDEHPRPKDGALRVQTPVGPAEVVVRTGGNQPIRLEAHRGVAGSRPVGWASEAYGRKRAILTLEAHASCNGVMRLVTAVGMPRVEVQPLPESGKSDRWLVAAGDDAALVRLAAPQRRAERIFLGVEMRREARASHSIAGAMG